MGTNIGAKISRIGFWGMYFSIVTVRNPQKCTGNYEGPYIKYGTMSLYSGTAAAQQIHLSHGQDASRAGLRTS